MAVAEDLVERKEFKLSSADLSLPEKDLVVQIIALKAEFKLRLPSDAIVGATFWKAFGDREYFGKVSQISSDMRYYKVSYADGDSEEMTSDELSTLNPRKNVIYEAVIEMIAEIISTDSSFHYKLSPACGGNGQPLIGKESLLAALQTVNPDYTFAESSGARYQLTGADGVSSPLSDELHSEVVHFKDGSGNRFELWHRATDSKGFTKKLNRKKGSNLSGASGLFLAIP